MYGIAYVICIQTCLVHSGERYSPGILDIQCHLHT